MRPVIMCTLTVNQIMECEQLVKQMFKAGMRAVRINTAHLNGVDQLDQLARRLKTILPEISVLIDTKGPELRTTTNRDDKDICLHEGAKIVVSGSEADEPTSDCHIYVNYQLIHQWLNAGDEILIDDARIALQVDSVSGNEALATVRRGGCLGGRKGVSITNVDVALPAVSANDRAYVEYASTSPYVDTVAHSFVRCAGDVEAVRAAMSDRGKPIIAKIENHQGISNLSAIIDVADGILIARGDLTACIGADNIPQAQQQIALATKLAQKPLYLATNILPSMMQSPSPAISDINGISMAVKQGVDVMLLTNETASGAYPLEVVAALQKAIVDI